MSYLNQGYLHDLYFPGLTIRQANFQTNITGVKGLTDATRTMLEVLGCYNV